MRSQKFLTKYLCVFLTALLLLSGCSTLAAEATPTAQPAGKAEVVPVVSATGMVVPAEYATLSVKTQGMIHELLAGNDQVVQAGDLLLRLEGTESLQAAIAAAQFELFSAQQALDDLYEDPEVRAAEAKQAVVDAEQAVKDAKQRLDNLRADSPVYDINQARANLILAREMLERAQEDYKPYAKKPEDNLTRAGYLSKLAQAQKEYDAAVRRLNNLEGKSSDLTMREAEADLAVAEARLAAAQRQAELLKEGPDPDDVQAAEARLGNAKAQLAAAQAALSDLELRAPFTGTVSELYVRTSEWLAPGQPVLLLADLQRIRVETTDLNEIDVARIRPGDTANVTFDALPDVSVGGKVARIASKSAASSGVNYTVVVELDEIPDGLRWGMTAFVDVRVDR